MDDTQLLIESTINECKSSIQKNSECIDMILDEYSNESYEDQIMVYLSQIMEMDNFIIETLEKINKKFNGVYEQYHVDLLMQAQDFINKKIEILNKINELE